MTAKQLIDTMQLAAILMLASKPMVSDAPSELVVPLSKVKIILLLIGAVAFGLGSVWVWSIADDQTRFNPLKIKAVAIANFSFCGLCAIYGCCKVFDTRPGLIIVSVRSAQARDSLGRSPGAAGYFRRRRARRLRSAAARASRSCWR